MNGGRFRAGQEDQRRPRRTALWVAIAMALGAMVLGPVAAIAAAGKPSDSGGGGLITTSTNGATLTVGTTTFVATTATTVTSVAGTTTTTANTCTTAAVGTVTATPSTTTATSAPGGSLAPASTTNTTTTASSGSCTVTPPAAIPAPAGSPFAKRGMWIWELPATDRGNVAAVIAQAKEYGIQTVYIKSGDGTSMWSQFTPALVNELHAAGLHVCAWQYVYGNDPVTEGKVGIEAARDGAECLVIDAESQYQSKYVQAQQYMHTLRAGLGNSYPIALAGFPYVDYHPTFPYSVFLGRYGAQYNLPQMYWLDIGTTVDAVYAHTYEFNELYQRPIYPLGQLYDSPPVAQVKKFRSIGLAYRSTGMSWWDWQSAGNSQFSAISVPAAPIKGYQPQTTVAAVGKGAVGDVVVLAQEHLANTPEAVTIDGDFGSATLTAVKKFQAANGLPVTGIITPQTWGLLLKVPLPKVTWETKGKAVIAVVSSTP